MILQNPTKQNFEFLVQNFRPYMIEYNFLDLNGRENVVSFSEDYIDATVELKGNKFQYIKIIPEFQKRKVVTQTIIPDLPLVTPHLCHHTGCQYYKTNYCQRWPAIPRYYEDCQFPSWFQTEFLQKIDPTTSALTRITKEEFEASNKEYARLEKKQEEFKKFKHAYDQDKGILILEIQKDVVQNNDVDFIDEFVKFCHKQYRIELQDLFGSIILNFSEYTDDKREVFEIPDIQSFFLLLHAKYPYYLIFIKKPSYILPIYIENKITHTNKGYRIEFNREKLAQFVRELLYDVTVYLNQLDRYKEEVIISLMKRIQSIGNMDHETTHRDE
ncbi:DUF1817 domain-containing protein [bacterium]|nr:MAG: DUF1817 domain-containing protein [bacterium]